MFVRFPVVANQPAQRLPSYVRVAQARKEDGAFGMSPLLVCQPPCADFDDELEDLRVRALRCARDRRFAMGAQGFEPLEQHEIPELARREHAQQELARVGGLQKGLEISDTERRQGALDFRAERACASAVENEHAQSHNGVECVGDAFVAMSRP
jgi:hypothetical protein